MKKKGLLISTIVMVVVLVASLTTATYAWFNVSSELSVDGFTLQVVPNTALSIGLCNQTGGYNASYGKDKFESGDVNYTGAVGTLEGKWTGSVHTLGASINHTLNFEGIQKGVALLPVNRAASTPYEFDDKGMLTGDPIKFDVEHPTTSVLSGTFNTHTTGRTHWLIAANGSTALNNNGNEEPGDDFDETTLSSVYKAVVNSDDADGAGSNLIYYHMGVLPTEPLKEGSNILYIVVQVQDSATLGIGAALHVAYRVNGNSAHNTDDGLWNDVDVFGSDSVHNYNTGVTDVTVEPGNALYTNIASYLTAGEGWDIDGSTSKMNGAVIVPIQLELEDTASLPDQVEIVIYIAGDDKSAIDDSVEGTATVKIGMCFGAQKQSAQTQA